MARTHTSENYTFIYHLKKKKSHTEINHNKSKNEGLEKRRQILVINTNSASDHQPQKKQFIYFIALYADCRILHSALILNPKSPVLCTSQ